MTLTVGSLFAGIGGFDLAARWLGWRTIWVSEIDPYCNRILAREWPDAPNLGDITRIDWSAVDRPDLLCGGFPCQPHSFAGKRKGSDDARDLWGEFARAIRDIRPRYVVAENVPGVLTSDRGRFFNRILSDLAAIGFDAEWQVLSAAAVGAPHQRDRVWIVAYPNAGRFEVVGQSEHRKQQGPPRHQPDGRGAGRRGHGTAAHPEVAGLEGTESAGHTRPDGRAGEPGQRGWQADWWATEPDVGRMAYGVPARVDRLRSLGNAIVPQCAAVMFRRIQELEGAA